uniref:Reticulon 4 receptor like 2 n=1 Tax=Terrapene triunguis TaxID=2587831 RepID=A0A674IXQ6_9SAUR
VTQQRTLCDSLLQGNLTSLPVRGAESDPDGATGSAGPSLLPSAPGLCSMWASLLHLSHNLLAQLPPDFSDELASLKELKAAYNRLSAVGYESLQHLESLEKLDLSYNQVASIEKGAFRGLSRLRYLYLQSNRLGIVHNGFFSMLQNLEVLFLGTNNISAIELEAFTSLHNVNLLALTGNQLIHLKFKTFLNIQTPSTHLQLAGNPWACDCDLQRVFSKILSVPNGCPLPSVTPLLPPAGVWGDCTDVANWNVVKRGREGISTLPPADGREKGTVLWFCPSTQQFWLREPSQPSPTRLGLPLPYSWGN